MRCRAVSLLEALAHGVAHREALWRHGGIPLIVQQLKGGPCEQLQAAARLLEALSHLDSECILGDRE